MPNIFNVTDLWLSFAWEIGYLVETWDHLYDYFLFPDNDICTNFNLNNQLNNQNNNWLILRFDMLFDLLSWLFMLVK